MINVSGKREDIIRVALDLFAENGFHGTPMAMIADKAGVGAGTIYRYFENKDVLIDELYKELEDRMMATIREGYDPGSPIRERFIHIGTVLLKDCISHPLEFRYIEQYHNSPYGVSFRRDKILSKANSEHDIIKALIDEGITQQVIKDLPLAAFFSLAFGPLIAIARDHILGFIALDDALIMRIVEACWDGVKR
ncbi:MAG: TetR/AcrR family transcriptional regulator [Syntrophales bacterium]|nr:TetR/AcrR family transcriptional regulator [Syntrophales bacterium]